MERILSEGSEGFIDIVLGVKQLLLFGAVVFVLCFSCGYFVGYYRAQDLAAVAEASVLSPQPGSGERIAVGAGEVSPSVADESPQGLSSAPQVIVPKRNAPAPPAAARKPQSSSSPRTDRSSFSPHAKSSPAAASEASMDPGGSSVHLEISQANGSDPIVLSSRLRSEGYPVLVERGDENQRVLVGPFPDTDTATKSWKRLREQGWNAWLVRR